ncbi:MAG: hypothetical protein Ta2D_08290 [Rickettsiales bacterium]|nr:MAG: hypothetical protein Ta2D_08290 [Rickettsiales bacterium]
MIQPLRYSDGWDDKSVNNLFQAINKAKNISFQRFLFALGIRYLGQVSAKIIAKNYISIDNFLEQIQKANDKNSDEYNNFINIDGIGDKIGASIIENFNNEYILNIIKDLRKYVNVQDFVSKITSNKLDGKIILFTGTLTTMTRQEAKARAEEQGAKVVSAISSKTDYLVAGEEAGSKLTKANELGVKIISEKEWIEMIK